MAVEERWQKALEIFDAAVERPEAEREAYLREACGDDEELVREVRSLLDANDKAEGVIDAFDSTTRLEALASLDEPASPDQVVGPYRIVSEIGRGGMGVVYRAEDPRLGRSVALKFPPVDLTSTPIYKDRLLAEARAVSQLDHPNICTVYDIGNTEDGRLYIAMAYYQGQTLQQKLEAGPLGAEVALSIAVQVAQALEHAHDAGIVHRDIKPSNLLLTERGEVKVLDFGLAKKGMLSVTAPGMRLGTVYYAAPELAKGQPVDHRADLWSLGATLYEMLTGKVPFEGEDAVSVLYRIVHENPEPLGPEVPQQLRQVVEKLLSKDVESRYQSARDLLVDLGTQPRDADTQPMAVLRHPMVGHRWTFAAVVVAIFLVLIAGVRLGWWRFEADRRPSFPDPVPLTSYPGIEEAASFAPDGEQVAFSWNGPRQDNFDLYVTMLDTSTPLRLTENPARDSSPAWSPDGKRIAFLRERPGGIAEVLVTTPLGGEERLLTSISASVRSLLSWSPNGRHLAASDRAFSDVPPQVVLIDANSGEKRPLVTAPTGSFEIRSPVFSPDGKQIAFDVLAGGGLGDTYLASASDGSRLRRITFRGGQPEGLIWSADGHFLLFARMSDEGRRSMWRVRAGGGEVQSIPIDLNPSQPARSPAGSRLVFSSRVSSYDIVRVDPSKSVPPSRFISSTRFDGNPQFSPDGSRIAFASSRSGSVEIWTANADGTNLLQLTSLGVAGSPRWSPDGSEIAFDSILEGNADIYVVSASGGPPRRITTDPVEDCVPGWSADGQFLYFSSIRSGRQQVWKVPKEGESEAAAVQVTSNGGFYALESADGKYLYYAKDRTFENAIWRKPVGGEKEEPLIPGLHAGWGSWELMSDGIYFINERDPAQANPAEWAVYFHAFDSGEIREVAPLPEAPTRGGKGLGIAPDRSTILCGLVALDSDLMLVENWEP